MKGRNKKARVASFPQFQELIKKGWKNQGTKEKKEQRERKESDKNKKGIEKKKEKRVTYEESWKEINNFYWFVFRILGTSAESIDNAENRYKFSRLVSFCLLLFFYYFPFLWYFLSV